MLTKEKNKQTMLILSKLRAKGPTMSFSPFPGEQDDEGEDQDVDDVGDITSPKDPELERMRRRSKIVPAKPE